MDINSLDYIARLVFIFAKRCLLRQLMFPFNQLQKFIQGMMGFDIVSPDIYVKQLIAYNSWSLGFLNNLLG